MRTANQEQVAPMLHFGVPRILQREGIKNLQCWLSVFLLSMLFIGSRVAILAYLVGRMSDLDVHRTYARKILEGDIPFRDFNPEYPPLAVLFAWIPALLDPSLESYYLLFRTLCLLADCGIWIMLLIINRSRPAQNCLYIICTTALGPLIYDRIDIVLGAILLLSFVALLRGHTKLFALAVGFGIGFKLIPVVWAPVILAAQFHQQKRDLLPTLALMALPTFVSFSFVFLLGGTHLNYVLTYHSRRGIQLESVAATIEMVLINWGSEGYVSGEFGSINLHTPYETFLLACCNVLLLAILLCSIVIAANKEKSTKRLMLLLCGTLCGALAFSKVLSPQFFLFVLPLLVTLPPLRSRIAALGNWLMILAIYCLTGAIFPWYYGELINLHPEAQLMLTIRNEALIIFSASLLYRGIINSCRAKCVTVGGEWPIDKLDASMSSTVTGQ